MQEVFIVRFENGAPANLPDLLYLEVLPGTYYDAAGNEIQVYWKKGGWWCNEEPVGDTVSITVDTSPEVVETLKFIEGFQHVPAVVEVMPPEPEESGHVASAVE